jgi:hypothetical protein
MEIYNLLQEKINELDTSIKALRQTATDYAKAYKEYRIALAKELVRLKEQGIAATLTSDIARGNEEIAELKFKEITTEAIWKANQESINAIKLEIRILENQISREYGRGEYDGKI